MVGELSNEINLKPIGVHFVQMKPKTIAWGRIKYSENVWIDIYVENYKVMKDELEEGESPDVWKEKDFRKEIIYKIRIVKSLKTLKQYPKKPEMPNV